MKPNMAVGLVALLQVNAGAAMVGGMLKNDSACSFAKSADMSADSSQCAEGSVVDARGMKGRARVMLVGEEKISAHKPASSPPSILTEEQKNKAKEVGFGAAVFTTVVVGGLLFALLLL